MRKAYLIGNDKYVNGSWKSLADPDPFYSESNMAHLRRGVKALSAGKGVEHDIIEVDE